MYISTFRLTLNPGKFTRILILGLLLVSSSLTAQVHYLQTPEGKLDMQTSQEHLTIRFLPGITVSEQQELLQQVPELGGDFLLNELPFSPVSMIKLSTSFSEDDMARLTSALLALPEVIYTQPFLLYDGVPHGVTDEFLVQLNSGTSYGKLRDFCKDHEVEIIKENEFQPGVYHLRVLESAGNNAFDMSNTFYQSGYFLFAEPDFIRLMNRDFVPNDQFFPQQWGLEQGNDADIDASAAWNISTGAPNVTVAILDEGVDLQHPDLINNLVPGFDATGQGSAGGCFAWDGHGTSCAGIVAASGNNTIGIAGVAFNSKIMPIRIAFTAPPMTNWITSNTVIANGINFAWQNGADVLSNSWSGGAPSTLITTAIQSAVYQGRNGNGSPVLFSAGNNNGPLPYPSILPDVIAVGATSMCDERKSPTSCDGEFWWGSNFGTGLDVMAPGVHIVTTDVTGAGGSNPGNYHFTFNGTSAACPFAAGTMALIISVRPAASEPQARFILESTCDKIGGGYTANNCGQPNSTWSHQFGYGRINAHQALLLAPTILNAPGGLNVTGVTPNAATLNWTAVPGVLNYNVRHRAIGNPNWTNVTVNVPTLNIGGLTPFTGYEFQVQTICGTSGSGFSISKTFFTLTAQAQCGNDPYEGVIFGPYLQSGQPVFALVCPQGDIDQFLIQNTAPNSTITIVLDQLPADYDLDLRDANGNLIATSATPGLANEVIVHNNANGPYYYVYVYSTVGMWNPNLYYRLTATITQPPPSPRLLTPEALAEETEASFTLFPNPASDVVNLAFDLSETAQVEISIMDLAGKLMQRFTENGGSGHNTLRWDVSDYPAGMYLVEFRIGDKRYHQKLILADKR